MATCIVWRTTQPSDSIGGTGGKRGAPGRAGRRCSSDARRDFRVVTSARVEAADASTAATRASPASRAARSPSRWACIEAALCEATSERRSATPQPANGQVVVAKPHAASCAAAPSRVSCAGQPASSATHPSPSSFTPKRQRTRSSSTCAMASRLGSSAALAGIATRHSGHVRCLANQRSTHARQKVCPPAQGSTTSLKCSSQRLHRRWREGHEEDTRLGARAALAHGRHRE